MPTPRKQPPRSWRLRGGTAVFSGTQVPVSRLFEYLEIGDSIDDFVEDNPSVSRDQVMRLLQETAQAQADADA